MFRAVCLRFSPALRPLSQRRAVPPFGRARRRFGGVEQAFARSEKYAFDSDGRFLTIRTQEGSAGRGAVLPQAAAIPRTQRPVQPGEST